MTKDTRVHIFVSGKVQGVYYRQNTLQKAQELCIVGWVRNLSDGRVESVMEGSKVNIDKMLAWCKQGPLDAKVEEVKIIDEEFKNEFLTFDIIKTL
ncbi:MAG TPA: acylphosphatase [Candidatus Nitrosocosmicus sp.]|nr:acylphosphatase [Candidatus Nitrosocosmicus sp.]